MSQKQSKETKQQTNPRLQQSKPYPNCNALVTYEAQESR